MKKKLFTIIIAVLAISIGATAYAKVFMNEFVVDKMKEGFSEKDGYYIMCIMYLSGENVSAFVEQKYQELGSWEETAEYYGVDWERLEQMVKTQERVKEETIIPDDIYNEMKAEGMTDMECQNFAKRTNVAQMDIETTWAAHKEGKTVDDLIREETAKKNAKAQAATDLAFGKIDVKEYTKIMEELAPDMTISEILTYATTEANEWMRMRKATSKITDAEIELAKQAGLKGSAGFLDACRMKDAARFSNLTFNQMMTLVKNGAKVDDVIKNNISQAKIDAAIEESGAVTESK